MSTNIGPWPILQQSITDRVTVGPPAQVLAAVRAREVTGVFGVENDLLVVEKK